MLPLKTILKIFISACKIDTIYKANLPFPKTREAGGENVEKYKNSFPEIVTYAYYILFVKIEIKIKRKTC